MYRRLYIYESESDHFKDIFGILIQNSFILWNYLYIIGSFPEFYGPHDRTFDDKQYQDLIPIKDHFGRSKAVLEKNSIFGSVRVQKICEEFEKFCYLLELLRDYESNCFYFDIDIKYLRKS